MKTEFVIDLDAMEEITRKAGCKKYGQVADKMQTNRNTVANVMQGKEKPTSIFMYRFVQAFDVAPEKAGSIFFKRNLHIA